MQEKTDPVLRVIAALVDYVIAGLFLIVPVIGGLVGAVYVLLKDGIMYELTKQEEWKNKSIGKKLLGLEVFKLGGGIVDLQTSVRRNILLAIGTLIGAVPVLGWLLAPLAGGIALLIEVVLLLTDPQGRRYGDRWAETQVIHSVRKTPDEEGSEYAVPSTSHPKVEVEDNEK